MWNAWLEEFHVSVLFVLILYHQQSFVENSNFIHGEYNQSSSFTE